MKLSLAIQTTRRLLAAVEAVTSLLTQFGAEDVRYKVAPKSWRLACVEFYVGGDRHEFEVEITTPDKSDGDGWVVEVHVCQCPDTLQGTRQARMLADLAGDCAETALETLERAA